MKLFPWFALVSLGSAIADDTAQPGGHVPVKQVLESIPAGHVPRDPQLIHVNSPDRAVILHGDLFDDGRHLALVASDNTTLAVHSSDGWKIVQTDEVRPAWVRPGKTAIDEGYSRSKPAANPFTLTDLDGDDAPELLVDTDYGNYNTGCLIARKNGEGIKFLEVASIRKHPLIKGGLMQVMTGTSGRKAWWNEATYYRWENRTPRPVARWADDSRDPETLHWLAERITENGESAAYSIRIKSADINEWLISRCSWKDGIETSNEQAFAKLTFTEQDKNVEKYDRIAPVMFEVLTGNPAEAFVFDDDAGAGDLKNVHVQVEGSEEAKKTLKRIVP